MSKIESVQRRARKATLTLSHASQRRVEAELVGWFIGLPIETDRDSRKLKLHFSTFRRFDVSTRFSRLGWLS